MPKSKKNHFLSNPLDKIVHWYEEAQTIPAQLRKSFEKEKEAAMNHLKNLGAELQQAKDLQKKAKTFKANAIKKLKHKSTKASLKLAEKTKLEYQKKVQAVENIANEIKIAKTHLKYSKLKQKYLHSLESAFLSVTKIFTKKHKKAILKKPKPRSQKKRTHNNKKKSSEM